MIISLLKRSSLYFLGLLFGRISTLIILIFLARRLQPQSFGNLILFITLFQLVTFFADFGLNQWYQKQAGKEDKILLFNRVFQTRIITLIFSFLLSLIFLTITVTFSSFISIIFLLSLIPEAFLSILDGYYLEKKQPTKVALKIIIRNIFFIYFLFPKNFDLEQILFVYFISGIFNLIILFPWRIIEFNEKINLGKSCQMLKHSLGYALLTFTSYFYARGDHLVIRYLLNSSALGLYGGAYRYLEGLTLLPTALSHNLFSISAKKGGVASHQLLKITLTMTITALVTSFSLFLFSDFLIINILGKVYLEAIPVLRIFSAVLFLFFINAPLSTVVQSSQFVNQFLPFGIINTMLNIFLNIIFIPIYGITAAAWIMLFTEITGFFINIFFIKKLYTKEV